MLLTLSMCLAAGRETVADHAPHRHPATHVPSQYAQESASQTAVTQTPDARETARGQYPIALSCPAATEATTIITLNFDVPSPRCVMLKPAARLGFENNTAATITVQIGRYQLTLKPHARRIIDQPAGDYLMPGDHIAVVSLYGATGPEIYVTR
jgi:hypothetical protein